MEDDQKSVKPTKKGEIKKKGSEARLHLIPSSSIQSSKEVKRPRPITVEEARWIAGGKKMKVIDVRS